MTMLTLFLFLIYIGGFEKEYERFRRKRYTKFAAFWWSISWPCQIGETLWLYTITPPKPKHDLGDKP